jgi:murein L,D-transpeptidase YafK
MKKVLFLFMFFMISLYGDEILDIYRKNGMKDIEQVLDEKLAQSEYWERLFKKSDLKFGYIQRYKYILVANKAKSTLDVFKKDTNRKFKLLNQYNVFTGKNKGDKQNEGDLRTPVGIYKLIKKISKIDSFYGPMAFVTSYPNLYDRYQGKNGHAIWLHGLPLHEKTQQWTKACRA